MKRYIKDGKIKTRNQIVIKGQRTIKDKDGNEKVISVNTFNPSEEMLFADGWVEYVLPAIPEPTSEELLANAKARKKKEIEGYDSSSEVNCFYIQGKEVWLDKATRAGLSLRFQAEQAIGKETTTLWYNGEMYELPLAAAIQMLMAIEVYASACYDNTQRHISEVSKLELIDAVEVYDFRTGYPEKLSF